MEKIRKVFLTGATGFIGSHVLHQLLRQNYSVVALSRSGKENYHLKNIHSPLLEVVTGDLLKPASFEKALAGCTHVIHIAGWISTLQKDKAKVRLANFDSTRNLWDACLATKPEKIVYLASIFAHGRGTDNVPCNEDVEFDEEILRMRVPYFNAKREAELLSCDYCHNKDLKIVFGYPGFCIGPGDYYLSSLRPVSQFLKGQLPGIIPGGMNFIDVRDAALGLVACLKAGKPGRKYLLGGYNLSWSDFFGKLARLTGKSARFFKIPAGMGSFAGKVMESVRLGSIISEGDAAVMGNTWFYDSSRAKRELKLATRPLEESLVDTVNWLKQEKL